jgi:hypothetical protein
MDTGFFPEANYVLAATGGLGFAFVSYWLHMLEAWYATIMVFSVLSMTSIWFHLWRTEFAYRVDNSLAIFCAALCVYDSYTRGPMAMGLSTLSILYGTLVFYVGFLESSYAFHPNRTIATFFHASLHIVTIFGIMCVSFFFPTHLANERISDLLLCTEGDRSCTDPILSRRV